MRKNYWRRGNITIFWVINLISGTACVVNFNCWRIRTHDVVYTFPSKTFKRIAFEEAYLTPATTYSLFCDSMHEFDFVILAVMLRIPWGKRTSTGRESDSRSQTIKLLANVPSKESSFLFSFSWRRVSFELISSKERGSLNQRKV